LRISSLSTLSAGKTASTVEDIQGIRSLEGFDSIAIALGGAISDDEITKELRRKNLELYTIGDAKEPREAREALYEGEVVVLRI
jgi:hypothetical protein